MAAKKRNIIKESAEDVVGAVKDAAKVFTEEETEE
jgi:hypothetical protein